MRELKGIEGEIEKLVRRAYYAGFENGMARAKEQVMAAITGGKSYESVVEDHDTAVPKIADVVEPKEISKRQRAPRGLPRALTLRVLKSTDNGATPQQIADAAETEHEKMIAVSSIRSELRKGEEDDRYVEIDGVWHLADSDEAGDSSHKDNSPASNSNHERTKDTSPVAHKV